VLVGLLESRDEELALARAQLTALLAEVSHDEDRRLLGRFVRWGLLPYLYQRSEHEGTQNFNVRRHVVRQFAGARMFLDYLRGEGATLAACPQRLADRWVSQYSWRRGVSSPGLPRRGRPGACGCHRGRLGPSCRGPGSPGPACH
jgi:hypothetical protein